MSGVNKVILAMPQQVNTHQQTISPSDVTEAQYKVLFNFLMTGCRISCKDSYRLLGIADLRSRISDIERELNVPVSRQRVPGKRYNEYFISQPDVS